MSHISNTASALEDMLKAEANSLQAEKPNLKRHQVLDEVAKRHGRTNWTLLMKQVRSGEFKDGRIAPFEAVSSAAPFPEHVYKPILVKQALKAVIHEQAAAIDRLETALAQFYYGKANREQPMVIYLGGHKDSGTEVITKTLAEAMFGDNKALLHIDCGQTGREKDLVSEMLGMSSGFVSGKRGALAEFVERNPAGGIIVLDEFDCATHDICSVIADAAVDGTVVDRYDGRKHSLLNHLIVIVSSADNNRLDRVIANIQDKRTQRQALRDALTTRLPSRLVAAINEVVVTKPTAIGNEAVVRVARSHGLEIAAGCVSADAVKEFAKREHREVLAWVERSIGGELECAAVDGAKTVRIETIERDGQTSITVIPLV